LAAAPLPAHRAGDGSFQVSDEVTRSAQVSEMAGTRGVNWQRLRPQSAETRRSKFFSRGDIQSEG
jgi:hypothetical protein